MYHKYNLTCFFNYFVNVSFQFYSFFLSFSLYAIKYGTTMINFKEAGDKHFDDKFCAFVNLLLK